jgi:hypothetical protein
MFAGCKGATTSIVIPPQGLTLPDCAQGQLISVGQDKVLGCTQALTTNLSPPSCPAKYALNAFDGNLVCMPVGTGSTNTDLTAAINNVVTKTTNLQNQINQFGGGGGAAKYCGLSAATKGKMTVVNTTLTGIAAAASKCADVPACGTGSHMCTPYEMFESASAGVITDTQTIAKSWVYMASWRNFAAGATEPTAGLNDNCGSYNYDTANQLWYGTAVQWEAIASGQKVLKFFTGNNNANCFETLPIACCK